MIRLGNTIKQNNVLIYIPISIVLFLHIILNKTVIAYTNSFNAFLFVIIALYIIPVIILRNTTQSRLTILVISWFFLSSSYFMFLASTRDLSLLAYWQMFRYDSQLIIIVIFYEVFTFDYTFKFKLFLIITALITIEAFTGFLEFSGINFIYILTELKSYNGVVYDNYLNGITLPHGTLERYNSYGNVMSLMIVYAIGSYKEYSNSFAFKHKVAFWLVMTLALCMVFLSGNRISLLSLFLSLAILTLFQFKRRILLLIVILFTLTFLRFGLVQNIASVANVVTFDNPITRQLAILTMFDSDFGADNVAKSISTITISLKLYDYIKDNILFGAGLFFKKDGYDGIITPTTNNISDAYLAWIVAEYGLVGLLIYLAPHLYMLVALFRYRKDYNSFYNMFAVFICLLIQTITDQGLFYPISALFLFTFFYFELRSIQNERISIT